MSARACHVLFLCTGNSARSILAEALLERLGRPAYRGFSAGSRPKAAPHPMALAILAEKGFETMSLRSKSWEEFASPEAPEIALVITVCDSAARESCPVWPGNPKSAHWSHVDPAACVGSEAEKSVAFERVYEQLKARINALVELDPTRLTADEFQDAVRAIGVRTLGDKASR